MDTGNPRSTASIAGHPIHPMLVMFPVTFFIGAWLCDILFVATGELFWATLGLLSIALGLVTALIAAVAGLIDYFGDRRVRSLRAANHHLVANLLVVGVETGNFFYRMNGGPEAIAPTGLILSTVSVLLLGYSGWQGGALVYKHGVGVDSRSGSGQGR